MRRLAIGVTLPLALTSLTVLGSALSADAEPAPAVAASDAYGDTGGPSRQLRRRA